MKANRKSSIFLAICWNLRSNLATKKLKRIKNIANLKKNRPQKRKKHDSEETLNEANANYGKTKK
jgi:hypothetical protein